MDDLDFLKSCGIFFTCLEICIWIIWNLTCLISKVGHIRFSAFMGSWININPSISVRTLIEEVTSQLFIFVWVGHFLALWLQKDWLDQPGTSSSLSPLSVVSGDCSEMYWLNGFVYWYTHLYGKSLDPYWFLSCCLYALWFQLESWYIVYVGCTIYWVPVSLGHLRCHYKPTWHPNEEEIFPIFIYISAQNLVARAEYPYLQLII